MKKGTRRAKSLMKPPEIMEPLISGSADIKIVDYRCTPGELVQQNEIQRNAIDIMNMIYKARC
jgi:hypothetical protein